MCKYSVYGKATLRNDIVVDWLQFEDGGMTHADAEKAALATIYATMPTDNAYVVPSPANHPACTACMYIENKSS